VMVGKSSVLKKAVLLAVAILVALNVWSFVTRVDGPDPAMEALHSEVEAVLLCQEAVLDDLTDQSPALLTPGSPEYPQGGEYEVRFEVELRRGRSRIREGVLCEIQFTPDAGWVVEYVSLD